MLLSQPLTGWICRVCPRLRGVLGAVAAQVLPLLRRVVRITLHGAPEGQTLGGLLQGRPNKTIFKSIFHYSILYYTYWSFIFIMKHTEPLRKYFLRLLGFTLQPKSKWESRGLEEPFFAWLCAVLFLKFIGSYINDFSPNCLKYTLQTKRNQRRSDVWFGRHRRRHLRCRRTRDSLARAHTLGLGRRGGIGEQGPDGRGTGAQTLGDLHKMRYVSQPEGFRGLILSLQFLICFTFILGGQFLLTQRTDS